MLCDSTYGGSSITGAFKAGLTGVSELQVTLVFVTVNPNGPESVAKLPEV